MKKVKVKATVMIITQETNAYPYSQTPQMIMMIIELPFSSLIKYKDKRD